MAGLGFFCAVALALVFVWAGAAKLARPERTVAGFVALGVPGAAVLARVVPAVELAVAVALLAVPAGGAGAAIVLLAVFTVVLVRAMRGDERVPCPCFGTSGARPVSVAEVVRNVGLLVLAAAVLLTTSR